MFKAERKGKQHNFVQRLALNRPVCIVDMASS